MFDWFSRQASLLAVLLALLCSALPALAASDESLSARRQMVLEIQQMVEQSAAEVGKRRAEQERWLAELNPEAVTETQVEQAQVGMEAARVEWESAELDRQAAQQAVRELQSALQEQSQQLEALKSAPAELATDPAREQQITEAESWIERQNQRLVIEKEHLGSRNQALGLAAKRLELAQERVEALREMRRTAELRDQRVALEDLQQRLELEQQKWMSAAAQARRELEGLDTSTEAGQSRERILTTRVQEAEERARLAQLDLRLAQLRVNLDVVESSPVSPDVAPEELKALLEETTGISAELNSMQTLVTRKISVLERQRELIQKRKQAGDRSAALQTASATVDRLIVAHGERLPTFAALQDRLVGKPAAIETAYQASVHRGLLARRSLPTDADSWRSLLSDALGLPEAATRGLAQAGKDLASGFTKLGPDRWLLLFLVLAGWSWSMVWLRRKAIHAARRAEADESPPGAFADLVRVPRDVLRGSSSALLVGGGSVFTVLITGVAPPSRTILLAGLAIWVGLVLALQIAHALLVSPSVPDDRRRPRLYRHMQGFLTIGAVLSSFTLLVHILTISAPLRDLVDRFFMLYLMAITWPALEVRRLVLEALDRRLGERSWMGAVRSLSLLAPISILLGAGVGLAGYVNVSWAVGRYLGGFLVVLCVWLFLARLLRDSVNALKDLVNRDFDNGLVWIKGLIEPLHSLTRLGLFLALLVLPLHWMGVSSESPLVAEVLDLLKTPLFTLGSKPIHLQGLFFTLLLTLLVFRAGRWARMIAYSWAYSRITDMGIRHSLSVFTQYALVLAGLLIALRLLGIDLTTLAIFAGALGVGIGFGLQNIANNFISGILLLIERPLRATDIVRVGQHEGEVTHIGMRSITVKTWDNQEVIMPNADVISTAFTNWTRNDDVVRTVLEIAIGHDNDPRRAKEIMEAVLNGHSAVLRDPQAEVWLKDFNGGIVNFHLQYFSDLRRRSRLEVRSEVLFELWDALKAAHINIPYPQQDLHIRTLPPAGSVQREPHRAEPAHGEADSPEPRAPDLRRTLLTPL